MPFKITFIQSGIVQYWKNEDMTLLEFAEEHGVDIEFGDRCGHCQCCATHLIAGRVRYISEANLSKEQQKNTFLPCIAVPQSDLVIDA